MLILVVDDDPMAAEMVAAIVEDVGYETIVAENGLEALEIYTNKPNIDLVISDMNMPLITGIELFQEIKGQVPFILLSGDEPEAALQKEPGLNACLAKDFSLQESLINTINQVMAK